MGQVHGTGFDRQLDSVTVLFVNRAAMKLPVCIRNRCLVQKLKRIGRSSQQWLRLYCVTVLIPLFVESLDRLAREYRIQEQMLIYLASKNINLIASNTGENVHTSRYSRPDA